MPKDSSDATQAMFAAGDAVIGAAVLAGIGIAAGSWLDGKLHTSPWLTVALALVGTALGLWRMVRKAELMNNSDGSDTGDPLSGSPGSSSATASGALGEPLDDPPQPRQDVGSSPAEKGKPRSELNPKSAFDFLNQDSKEQ